VTSLKELIQPGKRVFFQFYRKGEMWYRTTDGFMFPVPMDDTGEGTFHAEDSAITFTRWIRKQLEATEHERRSEYYS
jgi:hypothetical protein